ncbi:hypothetical protein M5L63_00028530 [Klebsiella pneumoniae]
MAFLQEVSVCIRDPSCQSHPYSRHQQYWRHTVQRFFLKCLALAAQVLTITFYIFYAARQPPGPAGELLAGPSGGNTKAKASKAARVDSRALHRNVRQESDVTGPAGEPEVLRSAPSGMQLTDIRGT